MLIANYTPDAINFFYVGVEGRIEPDDVLEVTDPMGNHILTAYGPRGLIRITYEDKGDKEREKKLRETSMRNYKNFWIRQMERHNRHNESLKALGQLFADPNQDIKQKSVELGIDLIQPWSINTTSIADKKSELAQEQLEKERADKEKILHERNMMAGEIATLKGSQENLAGQVGALSTQLTDLLNMMAGDAKPAHDSGSGSGKPGPSRKR